MKSEQLFRFLDGLLRIPEFPDYPNALNGLQVEGSREIQRLSAAVDASEETILLAIEGGADLLLVHHGLFWDGLGPLRGARFRKVKALIESGTALYAAHLPLDAHPQFGNAAVLAREIGIDVGGGFGAHQGESIGCWGTVTKDLDGLCQDVEAAVGGSVRVIGPAEGAGAAMESNSLRVGVVTGAGHGFLEEAVDMGLSVLITGEAPHHAYHAAREARVTLILAGHYATETWGVKALASRIEEAYGIPWEFLDVPTGL